MHSYNAQSIGRARCDALLIKRPDPQSFFQRTPYSLGVLGVPLLKELMINKQVGEWPHLDLNPQHAPAILVAMIIRSLRGRIDLRGDALEPTPAVLGRDCGSADGQAGESCISERDHALALLPAHVRGLGWAGLRDATERAPCVRGGEDRT